ncbi:MAG: protein O-mannosyl-transferase family [bacterium]
MKKVNNRIVKSILACSLFFGPFLIYFLTASRDIYWLDSAEFALAARTSGLVHPPGYPLLLTTLSFVSQIPILPLLFRINLVSAFAAAGSCLLLFQILNLLTRDSKVAFFGAWIWALSFELWQQATAIEAYAPQVFLFALTLYALIKWRETSSFASLLFFGFNLGLAFANHLFIFVWVPAFVLLLATPALKQLRFQHWLLLITLFMLGPLLYLTLLFRSQNPPSWAGINSATDFFRYITAGVYRYRFLAGGSRYLAQQLLSFSQTLFKQFTIFWLLLLPGTFWLYKKDQKLLTGLLIGNGFAILAALFYNIPDKEGYFLPVYLCLALCISSSLKLLRPRKTQNAIGVVIALALIGITTWFYPHHNRSHLATLSDLTHAVREELPNHAVLFTDDYSLFQALNWYKIAETPTDEITVISEHHLVFPWYLKQLSQQLSIPDTCFTIARNLWQNSPKVNNPQFGLIAAERTREIKLQLLLNLVSRRAFYFPQDFSQEPARWYQFRLKLHGLTYEFCPPEDTVLEPNIKFTFPGPEKYSAQKFYDPYADDLVRRFAATANRRGMLRYANGNIVGALSDFDLALRYYPNYTAPIENKGLVFALEGNPDSARFYLTKFIKLAPNSPENYKIKKILNLTNK